MHRADRAPRNEPQIHQVEVEICGVIIKRHKIINNETRGGKKTTVRTNPGARRVREIY